MANITWKRSTPTDTVITTAPDDNLSAWNTLITANAADPTFLWEVASYASASPKSLLLRRKDLSAGRIIIFGQNAGTPNAAAVRGTPAASGLYIGYSATSTSNTVDGSWLTGAPLSATDYMPAVRMNSPAAGTWRFYYMDTDDGMYFTNSQIASAGFSLAGAGNLVTSITGTKLPFIMGSGTSLSSGSLWANNTTSAGVIFNSVIGADTSYSSTDPGMVVRYNGANILCYRLFSVNSTAPNQFLNTVNTKAYFFPMVIVGNSSDLTVNVIGKLTQVTMGPLALRETTLTDGTTAGTAYALSWATSGTNGAVWFTNTEI